MEPQKQRESFGSRLGFILVSAGCAIGIGNVWRFPTVTGQNGGGIFVLFYLIFLVLMGLPVLTMELAVGRAGHGAARSAYKALEPAGSKWHIHGWFCMAGCALLMMYYTTVSGWMLDYFFRFLTGRFDGLTAEQTGSVFGEMLASPVEQVFWMAVITLAGFLVCGRGLQGGLEKVGKWMMSADSGAGCPQFHPQQCGGWAGLLSAARLGPRKGTGPWQRYHGGDEPVLLHAEPRHWRD